MTKYISCDCKCQFNSTTCNSNQKWNNKSCQCVCKNYHKHKSTSLITCDEIIYFIDIVSTKMANTVATNVTKNYYCKKV